MFHHLYRREDVAAARQVRENSARLAFSWGRASTHGWGEFQIPEPIEFDVTFTHQPDLSYGYAIEDGDKLVPKRFPRAWGGVYDWLQDEFGFYTGAHVFVVVDTLSPAEIADVPEADPNYDLDHTWMFSGLAIKAMTDIIGDFE
jgi:hypothetical protein